MSKCTRKCVPMIAFNNGRLYPQFGLGTWQSPENQVYQAVKDAIDIGYRHIDCAYVYGNEVGIGKAIAAKVEDGTVKSSELYITGKLWCDAHRPDLVERQARLSLKRLQRKSFELYLVHWPQALKRGANPDGSLIFSDVDYLDTWKAMEKLLDNCIARSIGVSNFNEEQLKRLVENCKVLPVTNQVECHPYLLQDSLFKYCESKDIVITAYSPLGAPNSLYRKADDPKVLEDSKVKEIAEKHKKSPAQVLIRYQLDQGHIAIPKSVNKSRIEENINVFDFKLDCEDMAALQSLNRNLRSVTFIESKYHKDYPFKLVYNN